MARHAGAVIEEIHDHGVSLSAANESPLEVVGVYLVSFEYLSKRIQAPVIVVTQLNGVALIGMNIIEAEGLMYDPVL